MQAGEFGGGGLLWPVWDVSRRPRRTYLSFLDNLKHLIVIHVRFTHGRLAWRTAVLSATGTAAGHSIVFLYARAFGIEGERFNTV
jgi:hypothetical protein